MRCQVPIKTLTSIQVNWLSAQTITITASGDTSYEMPFRFMASKCVTIRGNTSYYFILSNVRHFHFTLPVPVGAIVGGEIAVAGISALSLALFRSESTICIMLEETSKAILRGL